MSEDFVEFFFVDTFVKKIEIKEISPCTADPERIKFLAQADKPLEDVLPVLYLVFQTRNTLKSLAPKTTSQIYQPEPRKIRKL